MKIIAILTLLATVSLAGCGGMMGAMSRPYAEPSEGKTAKVRVVTNGSVMLFPGRNCVDASVPEAGLVASTDIYIGKAPTHNGQKIGMLSSTSKPDGFVSAEILVKADVPLTFYFRADTSDGAWHRWCEPMGAAFIPVSGEEYEVFGGMDDHCRLFAKSLSRPGQYPVQKQGLNCK